MPALRYCTRRKRISFLLQANWDKNKTDSTSWYIPAILSIYCSRLSFPFPGGRPSSFAPAAFRQVCSQYALIQPLPSYWAKSRQPVSVWDKNFTTKHKTTFSMFIISILYVKEQAFYRIFTKTFHTNSAA